MSTKPMTSILPGRREPLELALRCSLWLLMVLIWQAPVRADSWVPPRTTEVYSESRDWYVRIVPGKRFGDAFGHGGAAKGPYATAEWFKRIADEDDSYELLRKAALANPIAPVGFLVTDRGYLVTLDNWHTMGHGRVVASYAPDGERVAAYELGDLFSTAEIDGFMRTVSSIWWRSGELHVREGQQSIHIGVAGEDAALIYEPETGRWQYCEQRDGERLCRTTNLDREWAPFREPELREEPSEEGRPSDIQGEDPR